MKTIKEASIFLYLVFSILVITSCSKEKSSHSATSGAISAASAIGVGVSSATNDSIYVVGSCDAHNYLDSIAASSLPSAITGYLDSSYAGYTFQKAFAQKDSSGTITGYVVIIDFNGKPVGLKFDASGNFIRVLEQREGRDLEGRGWHEGGCFGNRDGRQRDTIALSGLPSVITDYFAANYPQDTLIKAFRSFDSTYLVFSKDNGIFATAFSADGSFVSRVQIEPHQQNFAPVAAADLPSAITDYLSAAYPGYVIEQAFAYSDSGTLKGYIVGIDANGTKYALLFDASGNFVKAIVIK
ncbi:MAG TPA: hypothetical protein VG847_01545 [Chitinophagaceae bacterium]|nr:hypothetical protein [Chitinophagaceae bacterium]